MADIVDDHGGVMTHITISYPVGGEKRCTIDVESLPDGIDVGCPFALYQWAVSKQLIPDDQYPKIDSWRMLVSEDHQDCHTEYNEQADVE